MYCAEFTGIYYRNYCKDKIFFAKNDYNVYDYNNNVISRIYVKKFYTYDNEIKIKYLYFGQKRENTGALSMLLKKQKIKRYKLINFKNVVEFIKVKEKNARNKKRGYL